MLMNAMSGIILIAIGLGLVILRGRFARRVIDSQNETFEFHFGEKWTKYTEWVTVLGGIFLIVLGVLDFLGIFQLMG